MSEKTNRFFSGIAERYDLLNTVLSLGTDKGWRSAAAAEVVLSGRNLRILDAGAGTGTLTFEVKELADKKGCDVEITALDANREMLRVAKKRLRSRRLQGIRFELGDALAMHYRSSSFDAVCSAFCLRNFDDVELFLRESKRVLKPGGKLVLLEMALPDDPVRRRFFELYSNVMRFVGSFVDQEAYDWLVESIKEFDKKRLLSEIRSGGFSRVEEKDLASGVAFLVTARKRS